MNVVEFKSLRVFVLIVAALLPLAACAGRPDVGMRPGLTAVSDADLPAQGTRVPGSLVEAQRIAPFDKLLVDVFGMDGMEKREVFVDAAGNIAFPLVGQISAVGLTSIELAGMIRAGLQQKYVRDPQVSVGIIEGNALGTFTVEGAVNQPGIYPLRERMTLLKAVAQARGTSSAANASTVLVFRTVDGVDYVGAYNLTAIRRGNYADPQVFAEDKVVVDEAQTRRLFQDLAPLLSAPLIAVLNRV